MGECGMTKVKTFPTSRGEIMARSGAVAAAEQDFLDTVSVYGAYSVEAVTASMVFKQKRQSARNRMVFVTAHFE